MWQTNWLIAWAVFPCSRCNICLLCTLVKFSLRFYLLRKRLIIGIRCLTDNKDVPIANIYVSHPPVKDNSGEGMGKLIYNELLNLGLARNDVMKNFKGGCYDGAMLHVNVSASDTVISIIHHAIIYHSEIFKF